MSYKDKYKPEVKPCAYCKKIMPIPAWKYCSNRCRDMFVKAKTANKAVKAPTIQI